MFSRYQKRTTGKSWGKVRRKLKYLPKREWYPTIIKKKKKMKIKKGEAELRITYPVDELVKLQGNLFSIGQAQMNKDFLK